MLIINFEGREVKGLSKDRYDETFAGEDAYIANNMDTRGAVCSGFIVFASMTNLVLSTLEYMQYSKTCLERPLKNRQNKDLKLTNVSLMKVKSIAECSH